MHLEDQELLYQFSQTDTKEKAFTAIIKKYQEKLYWHIRRMVIDHDDQGMEIIGQFQGRQPVVYLAVPDSYQRMPNLFRTTEKKGSCKFRRCGEWLIQQD